MTIATPTNPSADNHAESRRPRPIDVESPFGIEELFFSRTDIRGIIQSGNRVFQRVSKYDTDEILRHPHNVIRHPDTPRAIFRIFWNHLEAGEAIAAYVKNMAKDGSYYWVVSFAMPVGNEYLSVRIRPTSDYFPIAASIYREMRSLERDIEDDASHGSVGERRELAITKSTELLMRRLNEQGFATYDDFMHAMLPSEVSSRDVAIANAGATPHDITYGSSTDRMSQTEAAGWHALAVSYTAIRNELDGYMSNIDAYTRLNDTLQTKSDFLVNLSEDIRVFSLNAILACDALQVSGHALSAVASLMRDRSNAINALVNQLIGELAQVTHSLSEIGFQISASRLQNEQGASFVADVLSGETYTSQTPIDVRCLADGQRNCVEPLRKALIVISESARVMLGYVTQVQRELTVLQVLHINGRVESATIANSTAIVSLFRRLSTQVEAAMAQMEDFAQLDLLTQNSDASADERIGTELEHIQEALAALAG